MHLGVFLHVCPLIDERCYWVRNFSFDACLQFSRTIGFRLLESLLMHKLDLVCCLKILRFGVRDERICFRHLQPNGALQDVVVVFIRILLLVCVQVTLDKHVSRHKLVLAGTFFSICPFNLRESCGS